MSTSARAIAVDSSDIDNALIARLGADAALLACCPNGVYFEEAPTRAVGFVIVTILDTVDTAVFGGRAIEEVLYFVEARIIRSQPPNAIKDAAARIDALLEDQPLTVPGYVWMATYREHRERHTEVDSEDPQIRWMRRGGQYRVQVSIAGR